MTVQVGFTPPRDEGTLLSPDAFQRSDPVTQEQLQKEFDRLQEDFERERQAPPIIVPEPPPGVQIASLVPDPARPITPEDIKPEVRRSRPFLRFPGLLNRTNGSAAASTSHTVFFNAGHNTALAIVIAAVDNDSVVFTWPAGWTEHIGVSIGENTSISVISKVLTASTPSISLTLDTSSGLQYQSMTLTGYDAAEGASVQTETEGSTTTVDYGNVDFGGITGKAGMLSIPFFVLADTSTTPTSDPEGFGGRMFHQNIRGLCSWVDYKYQQSPFDLNTSSISGATNWLASNIAVFGA